MSETELKRKLEALQNNLASLTEEADKVGTVEAPDLPSEATLDKHESLMVDAIMWREDAASYRMKLAKSEIEMCKLMRQNLITSLVHRLGVDMNTHEVSINRDTKRVLITKRQ